MMAQLHVRLHFYRYSRNNNDWVQTLVWCLGRAAGYDMTHVHVAIETADVYVHLTCAGYEVLDAQRDVALYACDNVDTHVCVVSDIPAMYARLDDRYSTRRVTLLALLIHGWGDTCVSVALDALGYDRYHVRTPTQLYELITHG